MVSFDNINNSINALTADGMTAIDEGLYIANKEWDDYLAGSEEGNLTIILMTDGMDNTGQKSIYNQIDRAVAKGTTIYTVGFGSDIDDTILKQIANATGGEYFYAPNASVLQSIFVGIAGTIVNFTAPDAKLNVAVANNASFEYGYINATYIPNSSIITYYYCNDDACTDVTYPNYLTGSEAEPNVTYQGNRTILTWKVGNLPDYVLTIGTNWTVQYQLRVNGSGGPLPVLMDTNVSYLGKGYVEPPKETYVTIKGNATGGTTSNPAINITLFAIPQYDNPPPRIKESAYKLIAHLVDEKGPVAFGRIVNFTATAGSLDSDSAETGFGGNATTYIRSVIPGSITVTAQHFNGTDPPLEDSKIVWFNSTTSVTIVPVQNPRGTIILE